MSNEDRHIRSRHAEIGIRMLAEPSTKAQVLMSLTKREPLLGRLIFHGLHASVGRLSQFPNIKHEHLKLFGGGLLEIAVVTVLVVEAAYADLLGSGPNNAPERPVVTRDAIGRALEREVMQRLVTAAELERREPELARAMHLVADEISARVGGVVGLGASDQPCIRHGDQCMGMAVLIWDALQISYEPLLDGARAEPDQNPEDQVA